MSFCVKYLQLEFFLLFLQEFSSSLSNLSLDDIERIAQSKLEALDRAGPSS